MSTYQQISKSSLAAFRLKTDPLADRVIKAYFPTEKLLLYSHLSVLANNASQLPTDAKPELFALHEEIWTLSNSFPVSVLQKGQRFFDQHASDILLLLGMLSLPYCYAAANGAEVLIRSKQIIENPEKRLLETAEFVFDVTSKDAFHAKGKALSSLLKVRLMHAAARWYAKNMSDWDADLLGEPVNQEDMAGTNLAFSLIVIRGLKKLGKKVSSDDAFDYINYWNQLGRLLGLENSLLPVDNKSAYLLERNIRERQFRSSESGRRLTESLLNYFEVATFESPLKGQSDALVSYLLGEEIAEMLGVKSTKFDQLTFQPYKLLLQFQNMISLRSDSYALALKQFKDARKAMV